jgi:hypothetical protein
VQSNGFLLSFELTGKATNDILIQPRSTKSARKNDLWKETCFECFFGVGNSKQYFEFNGSTTGDWALYAFDDYRNGMKDVPMVVEPSLQKLEKEDGKISVVWNIPYFTDSIIQSASVTAVIKNATNSEVGYWALKHAGEKADFHLRESFIHRFI